MGEFLNMVLVVLGVCALGGLVSFGAQAVASSVGSLNSPVFLSDYLFGSGQGTNPLTSNLNGTGSGMVYNDMGSASLPIQSTVGSSTSTSGFQFPDWLNSAANFVKGTVNGIGSSTRVVIDILGFPYTLMVAMQFPPQVSAMIGGSFAIVFFLLIVMFILGRVS